jgi:hypothetical protein
MPPPYHINEVINRLRDSESVDGHPYRHAHARNHGDTHFGNRADLEDVVQYVLNNTEVYASMLWLLNTNIPYRYEVTVCLAGLQYMCFTPQHPGGALIQAARIVFEVDRRGVNRNNRNRLIWIVWTVVPYTVMTADLTRLAQALGRPPAWGDLAGEYYS